MRRLKKSKTKPKERKNMLFPSPSAIFSIYFLLLPACYLLFSLLFFSNCAPVKKSVLKADEVPQMKGFDLIPKSDEIFYGQRIASDIEKEVDIVEDEFLNNYLDELGKKIIILSHFRYLVEGFEWTFKIIDSLNINAFAALGGKVYVSRGLIEAAKTESELAGVLAFEIGHIMSRQIHQRISQNAVTQGTVLPGETIRGERGLDSLYQVFEEEGGVFKYFAHLKYYPDEVEEADEFALQNCFDAGFNPRGFVNVANRLWERERQEPSSLWLRRNPWSLKRQEHLLSLLNLFPPYLFTEESSKFTRFKTHLESLSVPLPKKVEEPSVLEYTAVHRQRILGNVNWTDTALDVIKGQEIYFKASGGISLQKGNPLAYCGPDGYNLKTMQQPLSDKNIGALIGKISQLISIEIDEETEEEIRHEIFEYFFIGSENKVRMNISGHLYLGINENIVGDNSGEFKVTLYLSRDKIKE